MYKNRSGIRSDEEIEAREILERCLRLRRKYVETTPEATTPSPQPGAAVSMAKGLVEVAGFEFSTMPEYKEFAGDLIGLWKDVKHKVVKSVTTARLKRRSNAFQSYIMDYGSQEREDTQGDCNDFDTLMKVDNHIHLAAGMTARQLLIFIKSKLQAEPQREVAPGKTLISLVAQALHCDESDPIMMKRLTLDALRTSACQHFYHRFDTFNQAYNPLGSGALRAALLKSSNHIDGEYFAGLASAVLDALERNGTFAELRLSVYGRTCTEWDELAKWLKRYKLHEGDAIKRNRWIVQIPRIYPGFRRSGGVQNFEEVLQNLFVPLMECVMDPTSHPDLADVLPSICGIDSVDDESVPDPLTARRSQIVAGKAVSEDVLGDPELWVSEENPPYSYYSYYTSTNIRRFNELCASMGRPWKLAFRPHAGEAGEVHHLATAFLLADGINHGINLAHSPTLQYLYAVAQIGCSVSPLSNNALFLKLKDNPFPEFLARGLNVTLSTDDPLMFHATNEPLNEEYTVGRVMWGLTGADMHEIAANSVRQSGFPDEMKLNALGTRAFQEPYDWDPERCSVPRSRLDFRRNSLAEELEYLAAPAGENHKASASQPPGAGQYSPAAAPPPGASNWKERFSAPGPVSAPGATATSQPPVHMNDSDLRDLEDVRQFSIAAGVLAASLQRRHAQTQGGT